MRRTTGSTTDSVHILITLGRIFSKVNSCAKHSSDVCVAFIKSFLNDGVNEGRAVKKQTFVALTAILISHFTSTMAVTFPESSIANFLYLDDVVTRENSACVSIIFMFTYGALDLLFNGQILLVYSTQIYKHCSGMLRSGSSRGRRIPIASGQRG